VKFNLQIIFDVPASVALVMEIEKYVLGDYTPKEFKKKPRFVMRIHHSL
jgi:hypothetical protein